jgi:serine/threonine protein kinase
MAFDEEEEATVMVPTFGPGAFFADRYRIDSLLGSGAMGRVYAAVEMHTGRKVALKVLHKERLGEEETVERFRREAEVLASIGHPCIVQVYAFHHTSDGTPYLAMEMLEGVTLKTRLSNVGRFVDPADFQEILDGISGALGLAHSRGIVHRDLKPDNIFLMATGDPRAKLVDFGLSRMAANPRNKNLTHSGMILGTPRYMAPEQIRNAADAGPSVDVYSLGVVVFECLSGQSPYPAQDYGQLLGCVLEGRITPLEQLRPDLPQALGAVLRKAMEADPQKRFQTPDEVADAYGFAIGTPSRRKQIALREPVVEASRQRRVSVSQQNVQASKGGTLALDLSAAREQLLGMKPDAGPSDPLTMSFGDQSMSEPFGAGGDTDQNPVEPLPPPVSTVPFRPAPQAYLPPAQPPQPHSQPPPDPYAAAKPYGPVQDGNTLFMASAPSSPPAGPAGGLPASTPGMGRLPSNPAPSFPGAQGGMQSPAQSYGGAAMSYGAGIPHTPVPQGQVGRGPASFSNQPAPPPPVVVAPKKGGGVGLFLLAMVVVIVVAALGGFAVRSYMQHGELVLPWAPATSQD